ncbi:MAG: ribonuclease Y [Armatimonadota bacterium]
MPSWFWPVVGPLVAAAIAAVLAFIITTRAARQRAAELLAEAEKARELAERDIETRKREALLEAKDEALRLKQQIDAENRQERLEISRAEERLAQKEDLLDKRAEAVAQQERALAARIAEDEARRRELDQAWEQHTRLLERISGMSAQEAREELLRRAREEAERDIGRMLRDMEQKAAEEAERKARNIIALAINRCAVDQAAETTVSVVPLPSDEMKGRIIGREGRNIRAFETLTGVDVIIDDTPEAVVLSAFDPVRREIARLALVDLVEDGRIHPARIEEAIEKARSEVDAQMLEAAEAAILDAGVVGMGSDLIRYLGRLRFRTSYGQNCLRHSVEVARLAGYMAAELKANAALARRAGLLHDIGKSMDSEMDGPHALIGLELLKKAGEKEAVIHCVAAHHNDIEPTSIEAVLVQAADAISASRPGARRESLESYVKRLQQIETIAESFSGVEKTFAIQAGREIRVMVKPEQVDDETAAILARETARRIEQEVQYPGQIKVTVIRETRAVDYAK